MLSQLAPAGIESVAKPPRRCRLRSLRIAPGVEATQQAVAEDLYHENRSSEGKRRLAGDDHRNARAVQGMCHARARTGDRANVAAVAAAKGNDRRAGELSSVRFLHGAKRWWKE
jgi:hypothetical protein